MTVKVTPEGALSPSSRPRPPAALSHIDRDQGRNRFDDDLAWLDAPERSLFGEFGRKQ